MNVSKDCRRRARCRRRLPAAFLAGSCVRGFLFLAQFASFLTNICRVLLLGNCFLNFALLRHVLFRKLSTADERLEPEESLFKVSSTFLALRTVSADSRGHDRLDSLFEAIGQVTATLDPVVGKDVAHDVHYVVNHWLEVWR